MKHSPKTYQPLPRPDRHGFTVTEMLVSALLLTTVMSVVGPLVVRGDRLWQDARHGRAESLRADRGLRRPGSGAARCRRVRPSAKAVVMAGMPKAIEVPMAMAVVPMHRARSSVGSRPARRAATNVSPRARPNATGAKFY